MKTADFKLRFITRCFCAGADQFQAEVRPASIRGELRWWFRVLGGWKDDERQLREQELDFFGGFEITGEKAPHASKFIVRVTEESLQRECKNADELNAGINTPLGYLLFPLRPLKDKNTRQITDSKRRGIVSPGGVFTLHLFLRGLTGELWESRVKALVTILGELGALGFRSRRGMGAMAFADSTRPMSLQEALEFFKDKNAVLIKRLPEQSDANACVDELARFLKGWRAFSPKEHRNEDGPGFEFAQKDHDIGLSNTDNQATYRPALGLPIIQRYSSVPRKNDWSKSDKNKRFASPVLLRPYQLSANVFYPLVVFVDARKWQDGDKVRIEGRDIRTLPVSLELYEAMKNDPELENLF